MRGNGLGGNDMNIALTAGVGGGWVAKRAQLKKFRDKK